MTKPNLKVTEDGRLVLSQPELDQIGDAIAGIQSELRETTEAIRTVADAFDKVTARMDKQHEAFQAIATAVFCQEPSYCRNDFIESAIRKIETHFDV